jgi:NADH-quinone oxidoreductase subunit M
VASVEFAPLVFGLALAGILYGALVAMVQKDVKKLVAYSSVAHLGFVMLGMFALNVEGLEGSILQMVNHGISTGALFILVGMLYERRHTREIAAFGGIAKPMPVYAALFGITAMSSVGLPMLNGFVGEFLILLGTWGFRPWMSAVSVLGVIFASGYILWMVQRVLYGEITHEENKGLKDLSVREAVVLVPLCALALFMGVASPLFTRLIEPSVQSLVSETNARMHRPAAPATAAAAPSAPAAGGGR